MPTSGHWLEVVQPHLPRELVAEEALACLHPLARRLPGDLLAALEARLEPGAGPVDLSLRLLDPDAARRFAEQVAVPSVRSFLLDWGQEALGLAHIPSLWLEFDCDASPSGPPTPSLCAKLTASCSTDWLIETLFPALQGASLSPAQRRLIRACHEAIPPPAYLLYAFCMLPRSGHPLRLEIFGLTPSQMLEYLARVAPQWIPHVAGPASLFACVERTHLSLDILDGEISPRIGIEGSYERQPQRESRWRELFERLVAAGLCTEEKRDAALGWPGWDSFWTAPDRWPVAAGVRGYCVRALSHVKAVCLPDRDPEAKVYLLFGPYSPSR